MANELEIISNKNFDIVTYAEGLQSCIREIVESPDEDVLKKTNLYLIHQLRLELIRISRFMELLDKVEAKYIDTTLKQLEDYPQPYVFELLGQIQSIIDRSANIISKITQADPKLLNLTIINNNSTTNGDINNSAVMDTLSREKVRGILAAITSDLKNIEDRKSESSEVTIVDATNNQEDDNDGE